MSDKKRKSTSESKNRPSKKQNTNTDVIVHHVVGSDRAKPVFAHSPGIRVPDSIKFQSFTRESSNGISNLLLHSVGHPTIDYTAIQGATANDNHLRHYVAVYDPVSRSLQVTEAKRLTVRSSVRQAEPSRGSDDEQESNIPVSNYSSRAALTQTFGTKKSKKAVQSIAENRLLAQGSEGAGVTEALISKAPLDEDVLEAPTQEESRINKPLPVANTAVEDIEDVYSLDSLVFPNPAARTLQLMPIGPWIARMNAKKEITDLRSRFVANRIGYIGKALLASADGADPKLTQHFQILRYIGLLLEITSYLSRCSRKRRVLPLDQWPEGTLSAGTPPSVIRPIISHFLPDKTPTTQALTLLRTTILALTLHIPPPSLNAGVDVMITEPTDISLDLALEATEVRKLYRELGCRIEVALETEVKRWGLEKVKKSKKHDESGAALPKAMFAKLKFPVQFPKNSSGRPAAKR